jgi:hypothetical protein
VGSSLAVIPGFGGMEHRRLTNRKNGSRVTNAISDLLEALAELRELDRRRRAHVPGSAAYDAATLEVDLRSRRLMDRFRDLKRRRDRRLEAHAVEGTRPLDARLGVDRFEGSRLN